ncbi:MAG TPA: ShlB/FhaC/HecB family hemolysin secretion/activation protein [Oculatellaceae cyanobacterium]|jgi:hemolysin activation/secretion protein
MRASKKNIKIWMRSLPTVLAPVWLVTPVVAQTSIDTNKLKTVNDCQECLLAQVPAIPPGIPQIPPQDIIPPSQPTPQPPATTQPLPPPEQLLTPPSVTPQPGEAPESSVPGTLTVKSFEFTGNTVISSQELATVTAPFTNRPISFAELLQARSAVTQLYIDKGYVTSGALIPTQTLTEGVVTIQVVEGSLESINITGTRRLQPNYVRSRIAIATQKALNVPRLLEALRLLQLDPLIASISAELAAGSTPGTSLLTIKVQEADTFKTQANLDNSRSPSVGSFRRGGQIREANLLGLGDAINLEYSNTDGSNAYDFAYTLPLNPRNGSLRLNYGNTSSNVIEPPFDEIDIEASSRYFDLTFRQPISQTPSEEFALGLTGSRRETDTSLLDRPFPLSAGADEQGRTRVSAVRFFQEWTQRGSTQVISARSQFSLGVGAFNATINKEAPDSRFLSWRGQAQWVRLLAPDTLFLVRGDLQLADRALMPIEQIGLGGQESIRGYRQDVLLSDNGAFASAELRIPILKISQRVNSDTPRYQGVLQLTPFVDLARAWNSKGTNPDPNTLASVGMGLLWQQGDRLTLRLDWGIPLVKVDSRPRTWQENGLYFSIIYNP